MDRSNLIKQFASVGLELQLLKEPLASGENAELVFGMTIRRKLKGNRRDEYFCIYPGAEDNLITVAATDKKIGQLVLVVKEAPVEFETSVPESSVKYYQNKFGGSWMQQLTMENRVRSSDIVKRSSGYFLKRKTPSRRRHFLLGLDERQLFIANLTKSATSVKEAHNSLKSPTVTFAEGKASGRTKRQGEWFFVNITSEEKEAINQALKKNHGILLKKVPIGRYAGRDSHNPHTADELLRLPGTPLEHGYPVRQREEIYVRGKVRHKDHETVSFSDWRRVIANTEGSATSGGTAGIGWID